ncbi:MAG: hypothetical protein EOP53_08960, partial [Sphingobacteriales bacterium]
MFLNASSFYSPNNFDMLKQIYCLLLPVMLATAVKAQWVHSLPEMYVSKKEPLTGTSFYLPDSNKIMLLSKGIANFYDVAGNVAGSPVKILPDEADFIHPCISPSGKIIAFYTAPENFMEDAKLSIFNRDSNKIVGSYKVPGTSTLERLRFSGDTVLHYYTRFTDFNVSFIWNLREEKIRRFTIAEDTVHSGTYDMAYQNDSIFMLGRYADSLAFIIGNVKNMDKQWVSYNKLKAADSKLSVQFTQGSPWLIITEDAPKQTHIYKAVDTSFRLVHTINNAFSIIAAAADDINCHILFIDSSIQDVQLINAYTKQRLSLPFGANAHSSYVFNIYPAKNILIASHQFNGSVIAYNLSSGKQEWEFKIPVKDNVIDEMPHDTANGKLFKVLIKQGSNDVRNWYFNKAANQLYLVKNDNKLVTVDADAKCASAWEYFYKSKHRLTNTKLLPGYRFI